MGNKNVTPQSWVRDVMDERRSKIWGKDGQEKMDYPTFWPKAQDKPTNDSISTVEFGKVYQYPIIHPENYNREFSQMPVIEYKNVDTPSPKMMNVLYKTSTMDLIWIDSIQRRDIYYIVDPVLKLFLGDYSDDVRDFLLKNFKEQLNFFGLIDYPGVGKKWFDKKLSQFPGNYELPVYLLLLFKVNNHFNNDNAPFLEWKRLTAIDNGLNTIPSLADFKQQMDGLRVTHGNFWLEMNPFLKTSADILQFWDNNPSIIVFVLDYKKALDIGSIPFPGKDQHNDDYRNRMDFFKIFKFKKDNQPFFNFPYWGDLIKEKYTDPETVNKFVRNYGYLMIKDVERAVPNIWNRREAIKWPIIPWLPINDLDDTFLQRNFMIFKSYWEQTALYFFFESNRPQWPPKIELHEPLPDTFDSRMWKFIENYPINSLKVPPYSFSEWTRFSKGWKEVFELQWEAYFTWAKENVFAGGAPNYVNPGEQLKNAQGELLYYLDAEGKSVPLINTYPDFGIMREGPGGPLGREFRYLFVWSIVGDWVWGDSFWEFFHGTIKKIFKLVLDTLRGLYNLVTGFLPFILAVLGIGVAGYYLLGDKKEKEQK